MPERVESQELLKGKTKIINLSKNRVDDRT